VHTLDVDIADLTKVYRPNRVALSEVNLHIGVGMFGLLGPNGAGKTTLMRILATLLEPTAGRVRVSGMDLSRNKEAVRRRLGYLPQSFGLYPRLSAMETLDYIGALKGLNNTADRRARVQEVLETVNLWNDRDRRVREFSGGMLQRLVIAQALLGDPSLLVVDEPTAGLDPEERIRFRNLLSMMSGDIAVLLSTHIVADVESICSDMAVIHEGRIVFRGAPEQLIAGARGKVWEVRCRRDTFERLSEGPEVIIIGARNAGDVVEARVISRAVPQLGAEASVSQAAWPSLEDAYVALMGAV
jgi:ABC-2 type transport system ATP-binding protein